MERKQLKELLTLYYRGECSDSEEQLLRYYFLSDSVTDEFKADQELFSALHAEKSSLRSEVSFESLIDESITRDDKYVLKHRNLLFNSFFLRIAAGIVVLLGCATILYFTVYPGMNRKSTDTYNDPKLAYLEAKKTLEFVSAKMNHGTEKLQRLESFNTGLDKLNSLSIINLLPRN